MGERYGLTTFRTISTDKGKLKYNWETQNARKGHERKRDMSNEIIKETENHTLYKSIGGDLYIENQEGYCALIVSSEDPSHEELTREWAETATDEGMRMMLDDNLEED